MCFCQRSSYFQFSKALLHVEVRGATDEGLSHKLFSVGGQVLLLQVVVMSHPVLTELGYGTIIITH